MIFNMANKLSQTSFERLNCSNDMIYNSWNYQNKCWILNWKRKKDISKLEKMKIC